MKLLVYIFINVLIIGLFYYSKLVIHKQRLTGIYLRVFNFFEGLFNPLLGILRKIVKPAQVGTGISVDMSQIILLLLFLIGLKLIL
jgi:hypothetical protein